MKRNILVFGLVAGAILAVFVFSIGFITAHVHSHLDNWVIGYGAMIIAFSFIFVGTKNYRDKYNDGVLSFGKAFRIGLGISLIGSTLYVGCWAIEYYCFMPDFMDKYSAELTRQAQSSGLSPEALQKRLESIANMALMYKNPVMVVLYSYLEVLPVGLVISLITSLILRRRQTQVPATAAALMVLTIVASFCFGFEYKEIVTKQANGQTTMKKVTGIGGIFFKCKDPKKMREWYQTHLGLNTNEYGAVFEWRQGADSSKKGFTNWSPFPETTTYFAPSTKDFMINYRVENLEALVGQLKKEGVTIADTIETVEYGKFVHIIDVEGNKVQLWEPNDVEYEKLGRKMGSKTTK